ncbi:MAG: DMT family transporter [archaeon]|nr:MAG: DMT family transporter [archaeon]
MDGTAKALAQTALAGALWGTSFPVVAFGIGEGLDPLSFVFFRFAAAAPLMVAASALLGKRVWPLLRSRGVWVVGGLNAVGFFCQFVGQAHTSASLAALLVNLSVVLAAGGGVLFLGERLGVAKAAGVALAFGGAFLLTTEGDPGSVGGGELVGVALYLVAAVSWAGYIVYSKRETDRLGWDPVAVSACIVLVTALLALPLALAGGLRWPSGTEALAVVAYTSVFNTALPFVLYQSGLKRLPAGTSAVVLAVEIVVAVAISVAFLGESLGTAGAVGAVAVLVSILLVSRDQLGSKSLSVRETDAVGVREP